MSDLIEFKRGELKRRAQQRNLLSELVFGAESSETCDIEVVTLKQHLRDQAMARAFNIDSNDIDSLNESVQHLLETKYTTCCEFVEITEKRIKIGVDAPVVNDSVIDQALALLIQVEDITKPQFTTFGEAKQVYERKD